MKSYDPRDGVHYKPQTTVAGRLQKETGEAPFSNPKPLLAAAENRMQSRWLVPHLGDVVRVHHLRVQRLDRDARARARVSTAIAGARETLGKATGELQSLQEQVKALGEDQLLAVQADLDMTKAKLVKHSKELKTINTSLEAATSQCSELQAKPPHQKSELLPLPAWALIAC